MPFFSSAGNRANRGFQQAFVDIAPDDDDEALRPTGSDLHDWGNGSGFLEITVSPSGSFRAVLQWNQPFESVSLDAGAQIDLDLYAVLSPDTAGLALPIARSTSAQGTTDNPLGGSRCGRRQQ